VISPHTFWCHQSLNDVTVFLSDFTTIEIKQTAWTVAQVADSTKQLSLCACALHNSCPCLRWLGCQYIYTFLCMRVKSGSHAVGSLVYKCKSALGSVISFLWRYHPPSHIPFTYLCTFHISKVLYLISCSAIMHSWISIHSVMSNILPESSWIIGVALPYQS